MTEQSVSHSRDSRETPARKRIPTSPPMADAELERIASFGRAIEALKREVEEQLGAEDVAHIQGIDRVSRRLELLGRGLIYLSIDPLTFSAGTLALWAHKCLELMEIGHMALHGAYDGLPDTPRMQSDNFYWKAPIDEASWKMGHNVRHHQYTNIAGKDPDLDFVLLRLSPRIPFRSEFKLQPLTNFISWLGFGTAINLHVTGMLERYGRGDESVDELDARAIQRTFFSKWLRYYGKEYGLFPLLAGPFFPKVLLANWLSELGRDLYSAAIIYCGHVGASDFPAGTEPESRAHWYAMQVEAASDVDVPLPISILCGALDRQIEHHLFPRMPPNRLRQISPRVREICQEHGVKYRSDGWLKSLRSVFSELRRLSAQDAEVAG
jgi:fatty acid desaturase